MRDCDSLVLEAGGRWPCHIGRLQGHETCEIETIKIDWIAVWRCTVWLCEWNYAHPSWRYEHSEATVGAVLQIKESCAAHEDLCELCRRVVHEIVRH